MLKFIAVVGVVAAFVASVMADIHMPHSADVLIIGMVLFCSASIALVLKD